MEHDSLPATWNMAPFHLHGTWLLSSYKEYDSLPATWNMIPFQLYGIWLPSRYMEHDSFPAIWNMTPFQLHRTWIPSWNMAPFQLHGKWLPSSYIELDTLPAIWNMAPFQFVFVLIHLLLMKTLTLFVLSSYHSDNKTKLLSCTYIHAVSVYLNTMYVIVYHRCFVLLINLVWFSKVHCFTSDLDRISIEQFNSKTMGEKDATKTFLRTNFIIPFLVPLPQIWTVTNNKA